MKTLNTKGEQITRNSLRAMNYLQNVLKESKDDTSLPFPKIANTRVHSSAPLPIGSGQYSNSPKNYDPPNWRWTRSEVSSPHPKGFSSGI